MKTFVTAASLAIGASAAILPRNNNPNGLQGSSLPAGCCFHLTASGGVSGSLSQLSDGQNRVGGNAPNGEATYCLNNGGLTDQSGRGCILTPPTTQFQCDTGATPTTGFSVSSNGYLEHNGDTTFYACPAASGTYNIYTTPVKNQPKCVKIELSTGGYCEAAATSTCPTMTMTKTMMETTTMHETYTEMCTPSTVHETMYETMYKTNEEMMTHTMTEYETKTMHETVTAESPTTVYKTEYKTEYNTKTMEMTEYATKTMMETVSACPSSTHAASTACPSNLSGEWQYPHLIVPVSSEHPDMSYGTSYDGMMNSTMSSYYNFNIPNSYAGMTCEISFMWPMHNQLQTSSYRWNGEGGMMMEHCDSVCSEHDSWNSAPKGTKMWENSMSEGNAYMMWSGECMAGTTQSYKMSATNGMNLWYFQDYNPCPIGLYMTAH